MPMKKNRPKRIRGTLPPRQHLVGKPGGHPLHVVDLQVLDGLRLLLSFDDGSLRVFDAKPHLRGPVMEPLKNPKFFSQARVNPNFGCVEWPNGADLCPDMMHRCSKRA